MVGLLEICGAKENEDRATFYLVFEFCDHDLAGLLSNMNVRFSLSEIKMLMKQLLDGLFFIHHNKILHRDLKSESVLSMKFSFAFPLRYSLCDILFVAFS